MENGKKLMRVNEIIKSKGKVKKSWEILFIEISMNLKNNNYNTVSYLNNNLILNKDVDLTLDIIDFIIDYGSEAIIALMTPEFLNNIKNLITTHYKSENNILFKILFLIRKWGTSYQYDKNYSNFRNIYKELQRKKIKFPSADTLLQTYLKFITLKDIKTFRKKLENWKSINNYLSLPQTIYRATLYEIASNNKNNAIEKEAPNENIQNYAVINKDDINVKEGNNINIGIGENPNNVNDKDKDNDEYNIIVKHLINIDNNTITMPKEKVYSSPNDENSSLIKDQKNCENFNIKEPFENQNNKKENEIQANNNIINHNNDEKDLANNINKESKIKSMINNNDKNYNEINNNQNFLNERKPNNNIQNINNNDKSFNNLINQNNSLFQNNHLNNSTKIRNNSFFKNNYDPNKGSIINNNNSSTIKRVQSLQKKIINFNNYNFKNFNTNCNNNINNINFTGEKKNFGIPNNQFNKNYYSNNNNDNFIENFKLKIEKKLEEINSWIDIGKFSYYNTYTGLLSLKIRSLSIDLQKCEELIKYYAKNNNQYCCNIIYKLKQDIIQTCERYNIMNCGKIVGSFKSAFSNNCNLNDNPYMIRK